MEATVRSLSGLLPTYMEAVRLQGFEDGSWQAMCDIEAAEPRRFKFESGGEIESRIADTLEADLGFTPFAAHETARRLIEPFALAAEWSW